MRTIFVKVLLSALAALAVGAAGRAQPQPTVVFADEFEGAEIDRTKWGVIVTGRTVNNEQQAYVDSPQTIYSSDGNLVLHARHSPGFKTAEGRAFDFISGRLEGRGKAEFTYGTVSARMMMTAGAGLWPAFWVLGLERWPAAGEMDVMENVGDPTWTNVALHGPGYSGDTPLVKRRSFPAGQDSAGWHVYSMDWSRGGFVFKVDDEEFYRVTRADVEKYGAWAYDTPKFLILNLALGGSYPQGVNKVTTPYPGLPQATVDLIKAGNATLLVDWVRVTR